MSQWIDWFQRSPLPPVLYRLHTGYLRLRRPTTLGARTLTLDASGAVLLVRHCYRPGWFLPGGGVQKWETVEAAAIRETREEGGVALEAVDELFGLYANFTEHRCDHVALYVGRRWQPAETRSAEIAEAGFFAPDALPADTTEATMRRIDEFLGRVPRSSTW
ncbi:MAG: NUDIX domain-containing protein [Inquilinus sp.]|nr:NUDIX domain-containing protein [Inquilinus sp.]